MSDDPAPRVLTPAAPAPAWARAGVLVAACTLVGLLFAGHWYALGPTTTWAAAARETMPRWYVWGMVGLLVARIDRRFGAGRSLRARLLLHVPLGAGATTVALVAQGALRSLLGAPWPASWWQFVAVRYPWDVLVYGAVAGALIARDYAAQVRRREREAADLAVRAARLEAGLAAARLSALGAQLHPHFLFNALNTVSAYVSREPATARRLLAGLGALLRASLDHAAHPEVTLAEELAFLDAYLTIERARFEDRLTVTVRADDTALGALVPSFLLQPLVENAITHGLTPRDAPGRVDVEARVEMPHTGRGEGGRLVLRVRDDGVGLPPGWRLGTRGGVGLGTTAARLDGLYSGRHQFDVSPAPGGGVLVEVAVPFRVSPALTSPALAVREDGGAGAGGTSTGGRRTPAGDRDAPVGTSGWVPDGASAA